MSAKSQPILLHKITPNSANQAELKRVQDWVAIEEPLEIRLGIDTKNGRTANSISITMRTPGNDAELAIGFLYSEAIITSDSDIDSVELCGPAAVDSGRRNIVRVDLKAGVTVDLARLRRNFYTTSSCGVCGKSSLDALHTIGAAAPPFFERSFKQSVLIGIPEKLRAQQDTFEQTGGLHAAAAFNANGDLLLVREDVGRHNAVDKVVGALLQDKRLPANDLGLMVSGRASFELMQKALVAGFPLLAAVSAPSSLAVALAREFDVTLVGFLRGDKFNIYAGNKRIT